MKCEKSKKPPKSGGEFEQAVVEVANLEAMTPGHAVPFPVDTVYPELVDLRLVEMRLDDRAKDLFTNARREERGRGQELAEPALVFEVLETGFVVGRYLRNHVLGTMYGTMYRPNKNSRATGRR